MFQLPDAFVTVAYVTLSFVARLLSGSTTTVTVQPGSAVPLSSGVRSIVAEGDVITGLPGAVTSTPMVTSAPTLVLPAGSVTVTVMPWLPSDNGVAAVQLQLPAPSTV